MTIIRCLHHVTIAVQALEKLVLIAHLDIDGVNKHDFAGLACIVAPPEHTKTQQIVFGYAEGTQDCSLDLGLVMIEAEPHFSQS